MAVITSPEDSVDARDLPECDMIMKGGVTSGVVYPGAVVELSKRYRFRGLGGASAGAIAAAMAAAAEYSRSHGRDGFSRLAALPADLGQNMLARLQPHASLQRLWGFLLRELEVSASRHRAGTKPPRLALFGRAGRVFRLLAGDVRAVVGLLLGIATILLLGLTQGGWAWIVGVLVAIAIALAGFSLAAVAIARRTVTSLDTNNFGFCDGHTASDQSTVLPITDWLNSELSKIAGLPDGRVLTYGDLWGDDATAAYQSATANGTQNPPPASIVRMREIDVTMMVTNISQRSAHKFPFDNREFFWCAECLSGYFDDHVIGQMTATSREVDSDGDFNPRCPRHETTHLRELPLAPDMPVIVGVRMSFSFPLMFSAVPLHRADFTRKEGERGAKICWFADGGIASNFPMHFFDNAIPSRPTFGISLGPLNPDRPDKLTHRPSYGTGWQLGVNEITSVMGSLSAMVRTMQNWQDRALQTAPGYRDRVVNVRLRESEGGLNLTMPSDVINELSKRGEQAAKEFRDFDIDGHRWARFRSSISQLSEHIAGWSHAWNATDVDGTPIKKLVSDHTAPTRYKTSKTQHEKLAAAAQGLADWAHEWDQAGLPGEADMPRPKPVLKTASRL